MKRKRKIKDFTVHRRHLPHWEMPGAAYHVIFTLLDRSMCDLARDDIAPIILNAFAYHANKRYYLYDHTVMPEHVHAILQPIEKEYKRISRYIFENPVKAGLVENGEDWKWCRTGG